MSTVYPEHPIARMLSDDEMDAIRKVITDTDTLGKTLEAAIIGVFDLLLKEDEITCADILVIPGARIDRTRFVLPSTQWVEIGEALMAQTADPISKANVLIDWINKGPSARNVIEGGPSYAG